MFRVSKVNGRSLRKNTNGIEINGKVNSGKIKEYPNVSMYCKRILTNSAIVKICSFLPE
jgi:hypothetical protein